MIKDLNQILVEWSYRTSDGKPDVKNKAKLLILENVLNDFGWSREARAELLGSLMEAPKQKGDKIDPETKVKYKIKDKDGKDVDKETTYKSAISREKDSPAYIAAKALQGDDGEKDDGEKLDEPSEFDRDVDSNKGVSPDFKRSVGDDGEEKEEEPKDKKELIASDHKTVEEALRYTKTQQKIDKKAGGREGVGLGTDTSRAGEAAVHSGLRMLQEGKSLDEIESSLMEIADDKDTYLNAKWVKASISTLKMIDEKIGVKNIQDVAWDTPEGRTAIGVDTKLKTSSDMFVRTKDGKNVGVSLKQDGSVFLNNGGWAKQSGLLLDKLKDVMPSEEHEALSEAMSIDGFKKDRSNKYKEVTRDYTPENIIKMTKELTPEERKKSGLSDKYIKELNDAENLLQNSENETLSENQMKAIARLLSVKDKEKEQIIRQTDNTLTEKTFAVLNSSEAAKNGMNRHVLKSMHVFDALGLNKDLKEGGVDGFNTMYGIPPDGASLDEESIIDLFGSEFQQVLAENLNEVRNGDREPEELEEIMAKKIEINYESGEILFKHENEMKYPLFYLSGRARGLGTSPVMELGQTSFMALALKVGSFDTDKWTPKQQKKLSDELKKEKEERDAKGMVED